MLFESIKNNSKLQFIDAHSGVSFSLGDILYDLESLNEESNGLVFLYLSNELRQIGLYFSFLQTNHAIVLLNEKLSQDLKEELEKKYYPKYIVDYSREEIREYKKDTVHSPKFTDNYFISKIKTNELKIAPEIKLLLSTSGTTGSPKFVKLSELNLIENANSIIGYLPIEPDDVTPLNLPIYYSYGLSVLHTNAIAGGSIVCGVSDVLQRDFWKEFEEYRFSSLSGVPYIYEMLNRIGFRKNIYPSLRYCTQAGGNLNVKTKELFLHYFTEHSVQFFVMYGQTEATARISYVPPDLLKNKIASIGKAILNGKLSLHPETNEILYSGPNVFGGYAICPSDLVLWENISVLHTGDLGSEIDGYFYITGRLKRFVKIFGTRTNLDELEAILKNHFSNVSFAVIGKNDKDLIISLNDNSLADWEIKNYIQDKLKIHPSVQKIFYLDSFPLTNNGKVDYKKIEFLYDTK